MNTVRDYPVDKEDIGDLGWPGIRGWYALVSLLYRSVINTTNWLPDLVHGYRQRMGIATNFKGPLGGKVHVYVGSRNFALVMEQSKQNRIVV